MIELTSILFIAITTTIYIYNNKTEDNKIQFDLLEDRLK